MDGARYGNAQRLGENDREGEDAVGIDRAGWIAAASGLGLAVATQLVPFLEMLVGYMVVLVHELGHALAGWLFGLPSVPAFDFTYGGGVTTHLERSPALVVAVYALFAGALWVFRANRTTRVLVAALAGLYSLALATGADAAVVLAMGHGGELLFAGLFLHRALSGRGCQLAAERPLYAWLGFHVVLHDLGFAWALATDPGARQDYAGAKGGGHWMDFSRLAHEHLGTSVEAVAWVFLVLCLLPVVLAVAGNWHRRRVAAWLARLARV